MEKNGVQISRRRKLVSVLLQCLQVIKERNVFGLTVPFQKIIFACSTNPKFIVSSSLPFKTILLFLFIFVLPFLFSCHSFLPLSLFSFLLFLLLSPSPTLHSSTEQSKEGLNLILPLLYISWKWWGFLLQKSFHILDLIYAPASGENASRNTGLILWRGAVLVGHLWDR